jgi:hypothetical protein
MTPDHPIVLKQLWIIALPDKSKIVGGASYHLTEAHRERYVQEVVSRMVGPEEGHEEPVGEPTPTHVRVAFYQHLTELGGSYRVR